MQISAPGVARRKNMGWTKVFLYYEKLSPAEMREPDSPLQDGKLSSKVDGKESNQYPREYH
jgi:hypothetical protein